MEKPECSLEHVAGYFVLKEPNFAGINFVKIHYRSSGGIDVRTLTEFTFLDCPAVELIVVALHCNHTHTKPLDKYDIFEMLYHRIPKRL